MDTVVARRSRYLGRKRAFMADERGAVSFEMPFVYLFLIMSFLLPLADLAIAGFQYMSALQAVRSFGQAILYSPPTDLSNTSSWTSTALAKADSNYPISGFQLICGDSDAACSGTNTATPRYYSYSTTITLSPLILTSVLCTSGGANPCQHTLTYRERFL